MVNVAYIISDIDKALAFEWIAESLPPKGYKFQFILLNPGDSVIEQYLTHRGIPVARVNCREKKDWLISTWKVRRILKESRPDVVHCHLQVASIIGLVAAKMVGIRHRIYTRHHSSLHHVYHRKGIFWDKLTNRLATRIVAISGIVRTILVDWEKVPARKVVLIPHGFRLSDFVSDYDDLGCACRAKYAIAENVPVIGVVSRFTEWKGVQYIIPAFRKFLEKMPGAILLLFNPVGDYADTLDLMLSKLPAESYRKILFEGDMKGAYAAMDIFVHAPIDNHSEAFGQIYVEALAAGTPSVFTLSGIAPDFIRDGDNALVVPFRDSDAIYAALVRLWEDPKLRKRLAENGPDSVKGKFDLPVMIGALDNLYKKCLSSS